MRATLTIGKTSTTVEVNGATPLIETTASTVSTTIDTKQVNNLPVIGRNVMSLAFLVPGWSTNGNSNNGAASTNGTWNNMPGGAVVSADFDGTPGISNRFRSGGFNYGTTASVPRLENVGEMTISTAQLDLGGSGTSAMRISIVSRHGTNEFHGRIYEDFRNTDLNANSWYNNAVKLPRNVIKLNDFGASVGGPILKNKLFFFGTWAQSRQPVTNTSTVQVLSTAAQQGNFTYRNTAGVLQTVNVLHLAGSIGRTTVLPSIATQLQKINGVLGDGALTATSDPNLNNLTFLVPAQTNIYYPNVRLDYNATDNLRFYASYSQTKTNSVHTYSPNFPGGIDPTDYVSSAGNDRIAGVGIDWTIRPTLINQFHAGYLYQYSAFDAENQGIDLTNLYRQPWSYGAGLYSNNTTYGSNLAYPRLPISSFYPMLSFNDNLNWQIGKHSFVAGFPGSESKTTIGTVPGDTRITRSESQLKTRWERCLRMPLRTARPLT